MVNIIKELVIDAQNEGLFLSGANADDIVDVIMGIYLITQFEWSHIDEYSPEFLKEKLDRFFTAMLSEYRSKSE
jgi:hypothetical protein